MKAHRLQCSGALQHQIIHPLSDSWLWNSNGALSVHFIHYNCWFCARLLSFTVVFMKPIEIIQHPSQSSRSIAMVLVVRRCTFRFVRRKWRGFKSRRWHQNLLLVVVTVYSSNNFLKTPLAFKKVLAARLWGRRFNSWQVRTKLCLRENLNQTPLLDEIRLFELSEKQVA